jgi:pimeloyl-ACP methyl ester carboxylesterase
VDLRPNRHSDLGSYARAVCTQAQAIEGKVVLLGHSQGGAVINQALGLCPEKIACLIFVAAPIPLPGEKPFSLLAAEDDEFYFAAVRENRDSGFFEIQDPEQFAIGFAQDASPAQRRSLSSEAQPEPIAPSESKLAFDADHLRALPALVIHTTEDRIITPATQRRYQARLKARVVDLPTGHLPMLTAPQALAQHIEGFLRETL